MVTINGTDIKLWDEWNKYIWRRVEGNSVDVGSPFIQST
jgi:hypothetical protein